MEFLGFKIRVHVKGKKYVVESRMSDKAYKRAKKALVEQAKIIAKKGKSQNTAMEIVLYNSKVMGIQNYYQIATNISVDCDNLNRTVMTIFTNRMSQQRESRLKRTGRELTPFEKKRYGGSRRIRYISGTKTPIYPIGYVKHKKPMNKARNTNPYSPEGRAGLHSNLKINTTLLIKLMEQSSAGNSTEFMDNRLSLFTAQYGRCAITGKEFGTTDEIHCHHKTPKEMGGTDVYNNLVLVLKEVHQLIHAKREETIAKYMATLNLNKEQVSKINELRQKVGNLPIQDS